MPDPSLTVRPAVAGDAATLTAVRAAAVPYLVGSAAGMRSRLLEGETTGSWLASLDGEPAGYALTRLAYDGGARVTVVVHPTLARRGAGCALLEEVQAQLRAGGAERMHAVADGPAGRAFALAQGCTVEREHRFAMADLATAPAPPDAPAQVEVQPLAAVGPRAVWGLHEQVAPDDPSGLYRPQPYETWFEEDWDYPDHAADLGMAATVDGVPVAFTHVFADRERGAIWSAMTGVLPAHRGRGLARLVKAHALRAARDAGMTRAYTANDAANAPMLAVNGWLGYRPAGQAWSVLGPVPPGGLRH